MAMSAHNSIRMHVGGYRFYTLNKIYSNTLLAVLNSRITFVTSATSSRLGSPAFTGRDVQASQASVFRFIWTQKQSNKPSPLPEMTAGTFQIPERVFTYSTAEEPQSRRSRLGGVDLAGSGNASIGSTADGYSTAPRRSDCA